MLVDVTAKDLRQTLARMRKGQAAGMEGWRVAELKALPDLLLELLADLFNAVEFTGEWPPALERALITLIPKSTGRKQTSR